MTDAVQDVLATSGQDADGWTTITFIRKIKTVDTSQDLDLRGISTTTLQWGYSGSEDLEAIHDVAGSAAINLGEMILA